jgi:hypothetical protein
MTWMAPIPIWKKLMKWREQLEECDFDDENCIKISANGDN